MVLNLTIVIKKTMICAKGDCAMVKITDEQKNRLLDFFNMTDLEFYERYLADSSLEEQAAFMKEFPDFLNEDNSILEAKTQK